MRNYVSFDFKSKFSEADLVLFAANILVRMRENDRFALLKPLLDNELQPAHERFSRSINEAADGSRTKQAEKRAARAVLVAILEKLATHLTLLADGSDSIILASGFNVRNNAQRGGSEVDTVQNLRARPGLKAGSAILHYDPVPASVMYAVEWRNAQEAEVRWNNGEYPSATTARLEGLPSRSELEFRVCALASGQRKGGWSVPVRLFVQ